MFFQPKLLHRMSAETEALSKPCQSLLPLRTVNCQTQQQLGRSLEKEEETTYSPEGLAAALPDAISVTSLEVYKLPT